MNFKSTLSLASCTAGALGMIAGSLVVTTAPAQAQTACPGFQLLSDFLALPNGCQDGDKVYLGNSGLTSSGSFRDGLILIDNMQNPSGDVHRITYSRVSLSAMPAGSPYTLAYKISIVPGSGATFSEISLGADVAGQQPGINITKAISTGDWAGGAGSHPLITLTSMDGVMGGPYNVPTGITELFILDTVTYTSPTAQFNSFTNTFTQTPPPPVPEPSALLGLGLLGLGGLISKTRRRG